MRAREQNHATESGREPTRSCLPVSANEMEQHPHSHCWRAFGRRRICPAAGAIFSRSDADVSLAHPRSTDRRLGHWIRQENLTDPPAFPAIHSKRSGRKAGWCVGSGKARQECLQMLHSGARSGARYSLTLGKVQSVRSHAFARKDRRRQRHTRVFGRSHTPEKRIALSVV